MVNIRSLLFAILFILILSACALKVEKQTGTRDLPSKEYEYPLEVLYFCSLQAVNELGWKIAFKKDLPDEGKLIIAIVPRSLSTRAFKMEIFLRPKGQKTSIDLKAILEGQLLDWGRLKREIIKFYVILDEKIENEECIS